MVQRVTANDVARVAGISRSAVSRAFTDGASVSEEMRRKAHAAAESLGYRPNAIARMLNKQRSEIVGVVLGSLTNPFLSHLSARLLDRLQAAGFRPLLFQANSREELDALLPVVLQYQVSAILVTGFTPQPGIADSCARAGAPVLVVNRVVPADYPGVSVATDHYAGGRLAATVLAQAGYERFIAIVGDTSMSTHQARLRGFADGLGELGHRLRATMDGPFTHEGGFKATLAALSAEPDADVLFCSGDILAFGAIDAARHRLGLDIPRQLGVLGFDDVPMASWPGYHLSTIRQPVEEIAEETILIVDKLTKRSGSLGEVRLVAPIHVQRGTTRV